MKSINFIFILTFIALNSFGQELKKWGELNGYTLFTESSKSYLNMPITYSDLFNNLNDINKIKVYDGSNLVTDISLAQELVKLHERKLLIDYYLTNSPDYLFNEWINNNDLYEYYDPDVSSQKFWLPSGSIGNIDPDFINYVVNHAIKGTTTTGLNNFERRVSVYKDIIFTSIIPESGGFDDFEANFDAEFLRVFDKAIQNYVKPIEGNLIKVNEATLAFYEGFINQLNYSTDIIPQIGLSTRPKIWLMKNNMKKDLEIFKKYGYILEVANVGIDVWKNYMKVLLIKSYQDSDAQIRLSVWQNVKENYLSELDPALVEAIDKATIEINEYFDSEAILKMALENYFSDLDTYVSIGLFIAKEAASIYVKHLTSAATYHLTSSFAAALGPVLLGITVAYETWKILNEGDRMFEAVVASATIERNLIACTPSVISSFDDYEHISVINNIRQLFAYFFYINLYDRLDQLGWYGEFVSSLKGTPMEVYREYENYLLKHKNIIVPWIQEFRPDFFPRGKNDYYALYEKISTEIVFHDYSLKSLSLSKTSLTVGESVVVSALIKNEGTAIEPDNQIVNFYVDGTIVNTVSNFATLAPGEERTQTFNWTATDGVHMLKVEVVLAGDENEANNSKSTTLYAGSTGSLLVNGEANPVMNINLAPGASDLYTVQLQNTGESDLTVYPMPGTSSNLLVSLTGGVEVNIPKGKTISYAFTLSCNNIAKPGDVYNGSLTFQYNDKTAVVTFTVTIMLSQQGVYDRVIQAGNILIDGGNGKRYLIYNNVNNLSTFWLDDDGTTSWLEKYTLHNQSFDQSEIDKMNNAIWSIQEIYKQKYGDGLIVRAGGKSKSYTSSISGEKLDILEWLKSGSNSFTMELDKNLASTPDEYWRLTNADITIDISASAWASSWSIGQSDLDKWGHGTDYIRVSYDIDNVYKEGLLHLYNNGKKINQTLLSPVKNSDIGHSKYFLVKLSELGTSNYFNIKGDFNNGTRLDISNIRLNVVYYDGDPDVRCTKSLSQYAANINEQVTVTLAVENIGTNIADNPKYNDSPLLDGLVLQSGSLSGGFSDLSPKEKDNKTYIIKATKPGNYSFGASKVTYLDPSGHNYTAQFNAVNLEVTGGNLIAASELSKDNLQVGENLIVSATVKESVAIANVIDAIVTCTITNKSTEAVYPPFYLVYDSNSEKYIGPAFEAIEPGSYEVVITAEKQHFNIGVVTPSLKFLVNAPPSLEITPLSQSVDFKQGVAYYNVTSNIEWNISDDEDWLEAVKMDNTTIKVSYNENMTSSPRFGNIIISSSKFPDKTISLYQGKCSLLLSTTKSSFSGASENSTLSVTSNSDWSVSSDATWITFDNTVGTGNLDVVFKVLANTENTQRIGIITVNACNSSKTITVTQEKPEPIKVKITSYYVGESWCYYKYFHADIEIVSDGKIKDRGLFWGTTPDPVNDGEKVPTWRYYEDYSDEIYYLTTGIYYVCAYAEDETGMGYSEVVKIEVLESIHMDFEYNIVVNGTSARIEIIANGVDGPPYYYSIYVSDDQNNTIYYEDWVESNTFLIEKLKNSSIYNVEMWVYNQFECGVGKQTSITIGNSFQADFISSDTIGPPGIEFRFNDLSLGNPTSWLWDFGDGKTSTEQNPTHVYNQNGLFDVTLIIENEYGKDTLIKADYIEVSTPELKANFSVSNTDVTFPQKVQFIDESIGNPTSWFWNFGDYQTSTEQNPEHLYLSGTYTVTLIVGNEIGFDTIVKQNIILAHCGLGFGHTVPSQIPQEGGNYSIGVYSEDENLYWHVVLGGDTISQGFNGPGGGILGVSYFEVKPNKSPEPLFGEIYVSVCQVDTLVLIQQEGNPNGLIANFKGSNTTGFTPFEVQFTDQSVGNSTSWLWDFGDGGRSTEQNPTHTYSLAGCFNVQLVVSNGMNSDSLSKENYILVELSSNCPKHFHTVWEGTSGTEHMTINVINAKLDGVDLEPGDEVGVFDGNICVGFEKLTKTINQQNLLTIKVSKNDGSGNGFTGGHDVSYKIWDCSAGVEYEITEIQCFNNQLSAITCIPFEAGATAFVKLSGVSIICQTVHFRSGWNIFSIPNQPVQAAIDTIFQLLINNNSLVKIQDEGGNSLEDWGIFGGWTNGIGNINPTEGYKIKVSLIDSVKISGRPVKFPFAIPLQSGWNIIGYPQTKAFDGLNVVQQLIDRGTLIKVQDELGSSIEDWGIFGGWTNGIGDFMAGEGYKIKVSAKDTLWIYDNYPKSTTILPDLIANIHFQPEFEGNGVDHMNINVVGLPVNMLEAGDELAVYDGETCVGAVTILPHNLRNQTVSIAASATDKQGMPGFAEGNPITLKLWNSRKNHESTIEAEIVKGTSTFTKHETTVASLEKYAVTGLEGLPGSATTEINCYPNPFGKYIIIENHEKVGRIKITNVLGQTVIDTENPQHFTNTEKLTDGIYFVTLYDKNDALKSIKMIKNSRK